MSGLCKRSLWAIDSGKVFLVAAAVAVAATPALFDNALAQGLPGSGGFDALDGPNDIDAFEMGGDAYVVVASGHSRGIQLVRIHENGTLEAADSAHNGSGGFDALDVPSDIDAFEMGGGTYALVTSQWGNGIQLVRIHENGTLEAAGSATNGRGGFDMLHGPSDIDVFEMGGGTYALVTSDFGSGIQLIYIHGNGTLAAAGSATNGRGGFDELRRPIAVDVFKMGGGAYAAVASRSADVIQLVRIHGNGTLEAAGSVGSHFSRIDRIAPFVHPSDIAAFEMGGGTYVMVTSKERVIKLARVYENGTFEAAGLATDRSAGFHRYFYPAAVDVFEMAGDAYAVAVSTDSIQLVRIHENGTLEAAGFDTLHRAADTVDTFEMGGSVHAMVATSSPDNGIHLIRVHGNGTLEAVASATGDSPSAPPPSAPPPGAVVVPPQGAVVVPPPPGGTVEPPQPPPGGTVVLPPGGTVVLPPGGTVSPPPGAVFGTLNGPSDVDAFGMGGSAYALVSASQDHGIQLVRIYGNGTLVPAGSALLGSGGFDTLRFPNAVDVFEMGGATYAMVAAGRSVGVHGIQLVRIHENGTLEAAGSAVHGSGGFTLRLATSAEVFEMAGGTYAAVDSWHGAGAVQLVRIHEDGRLEAAGSAHGGSGGFPQFYGARTIDAFEMGDAMYISVVWSYPATGFAMSFDSGILLTRIHGNGTLEAVASVTDASDGFRLLRGAAGADVFKMGGTTYIAVASAGGAGEKDGILLVRIHGNGTLEAAGSAVYGTAGFDALAAAFDVDAFEMGGATYAAVASFGHRAHPDGYDYDDLQPVNVDGGGIQLIRIHKNGTLEPAGSATDGTAGFDTLHRAGAIDTFEMDSGVHAMVATWHPDNGIQLARIHGNGTLEAAASATDGTAARTPLTPPQAVVVTETPGITHITPGPGGTLPPNQTGISRAVASVTFAPGTNFTSTGTGEAYAGKINVTVAGGERREAAIGALAGLGGAGTGGRVGIVVEIGDPNADITLSSVAAVWLWNQPPSAVLYHMNSTGGITAIPECGSAADPVGWLERTDSTPFCHAAPGGGAGTGHYTIYTYRLSTFFAAVVPPPPPPPAVDPPPPAVDPPPPAVDPPPQPPPQPPGGNGSGPAPPPPADGGVLCSIRLGDASLSLDVSPGGASDPARQTIRNEGSQSLAGVEISASPWYLDPAGDPPYGADVPSLPPSLTELSAEYPPRGEFAALLADGTAPSPLAAGLEPGGESGLWFRINLDGRPEQGGTLVQYVTYVAECVPP